MTKPPLIPWAQPKLFGNEEALVVDALRSAWISGGPYVTRFEAEVADRMGVENAIAVSNGTVAIELALRGLKIGPGDEVIVPGFTFVAAANMVLSVGAKPVYADVDEQTWLLAAGEISRLVTSRTKAVMPVHLYGNVADMNPILAEARKHNIAVIEDSAEAAFSRCGGHCAGTMGEVGTFSLHATKTITTGEGGIVVTGNNELASRMRMIRDHGMRPGKRYWHDVIGANYRLTNLQAAIGCAQLVHLDDIIEDRRRIHVVYNEKLKSVEGIQLQLFKSDVSPVLWVITALIVGDDLDEQRKRRDDIIELLLLDGIESRPGFYAYSLMPPYDAEPLPNCLRASAGIISLPTFYGMSMAQIQFVCERFLHHLRKTGERT